VLTDQGIAGLVQQLGASTGVVEEDSAWAQLRPIGARVLPFFLAAYPKTRKWQGRASFIYHALQFARTDPLAAKLATMALWDKSRSVRYRACMLLACALDRNALPELRRLSEHEDSGTVADARAAIDAITHQNHHFYIDRDHTGRVKLNFDGSPLHEELAG